MELRENKRRQCAFMCIYVHLHPTVSVEGLAVWFPDRPGIEEIKWNQKEIRITAASFSTHTCTALLSPDGNTHLHTFFDLLSLNLDVWFSFRLWGFFSFWQSFSFRQTDGAWSHERAVQMFRGSVGQTRGCGWQAWLIDKSNTHSHLGYKWIPSTKEKNIKVQI